jgi:hypothetical protein
MPDDCPVSDESRRTLRDLARRAEWRGRPGAAGAAADARSLRELGSEIENVLARDPESQPDDTTWARQAAASLAAYCQRAQPNWTPEQIAELSRLRENATIALAPGPGELEPDPDPKAARNPLSSIPLLASVSTRLGSRRPAVVALAVVCCLVLIALVLTLPHLLSNDSAQTPAASSTTTFPVTPTTQPASTPTPTTSNTATTSTSAGASTTPTSSASSTPSASGAGSSSHVTAIQIAPEPQQGYPEVIVSGTITASGTGDITVNITVTGSSGQPQVTPIDDSGQTSYDLTQTIYLNQWCGQSSVRLTVSSGTVSQSATVPVSGC